MKNDGKKYHTAEHSFQTANMDDEEKLFFFSKFCALKIIAESMSELSMWNDGTA